MANFNNIPGIEGFATAAQARLVLLQSGKLVHAPADAIGLQPFDPTLTALAGLDTTPGMVAQTGPDQFAKRTLQAPAAGLTITNPAGTAGNPAFALANDLAAVEGLASTGIARRTGTDSWALVSYAQSAFTPVVVGTTSAGVGTYTEQVGRHTRIGDLVFFHIGLTWTAHTGTGNIRIEGLPVSAALGLTPLPVSFFSLATAGPYGARILSGTTIEPFAGGAIPMDTAGTMRFAGFYFA